MVRIIITQYNEIEFLMVYEDDVLVEVHPLLASNSLQIGNIYLGRIQKKVKNINSAFISLDGDNLGYLPLDDKPALILNRQLPKGLSSIAESDLILVQVEQEPQKMKQARVTGNINLSGKYAAVDLNEGNIGVSKRISDNTAREHLKQLLEDFIHGNFDLHYGYVLRTACEGADDSDIIDELKSLTSQMDALIKRATYERRTGLLYGDKPEYITFIENYGIDRISEIKTDINEVYDVLVSYYDSIIYMGKNDSNDSDDKLHISKYEDKDYPYYKLLGLEAEIGRLLNKKVWLKSGGFLIIEPTEAMVVIDVNTGKSIGKKDRDAHILKINLEAAAEVAKQLRLRNLSGIIMVDFINMGSDDDKNKIANCLRREFSKDKVSTHFIEITKLDVFEITRKKQRRPLHEILYYKNDSVFPIEK